MSERVIEYSDDDDDDDNNNNKSKIIYPQHRLNNSLNLS